MSRGSDMRKKKKSNVVIFLIVFVLLALSLIGALGGLGNAIKSFLVGTFGFFSFILLAILALLTILIGCHFFRKRGRRRAFIFLVVLTVIIFMYLQVVTTDKLYEGEISFSGYLSACHAEGIKTAGGMAFGVLVYPLISAMRKYAAIPLAVLFFVVLFFALLPLMRVSKSESEPEELPKDRKEKKQSPKGGKLGIESLRLYVDKVRPGEKNATTIKTRRNSSKATESYRLFDVFDTSSVLRSPSTVPPAKPERYSPYRDGNDVSDYEDDFDLDSTRSYADNAPKVPVEPLPVQDETDLPLFMRHATEHAQAAKKLYGDDNLRNVIPDEPSFGTQPAAPKKSPIRSTPLVDYPKKAPAVGSMDIIEDLEDLKRVNEKNAAKRPQSLFLGESSADEKKPDPVDADVKPSRIPVMNPEPEASKLEKETDKFEEPFEADEGYDVVEEEEKEDDSYMPPQAPVSTITPREASVIQPRESRPIFREPDRPAPIIPRRSEETRSTSSFEEEENDAPQVFSAKQRKPRSDIGGTHCTESKQMPQNTFIPPKQTEQVGIEQAMEEVPMRPYTAPPVSLLKEYPPMQDEEDVEERGEALVQALSSFSICSEIIDHKTGPTFTQFAVSLPDNMSVNKLTPLEKDIKRKLKIEKNIRIIPSVPGLDAVGIEIPNKKSSMIGLRSLISSPDFEKENKLYFAIGVDVSGRPVYGDLLKMPHLLVAGSTGSGKSVCLNVMICSILYHYSPETVRFIMVDPKKVELTVYRNMPHMVMPNTVTDVGKAINALNWAVNEMERRYDVLQENNCRNIVEYNEMQKKKGGKKMYYIVIIVDEMADLMSRAKRDVEDKIQSLTSKARAAGIHLVVATQRPSVDVITGTIKNNIPTRIAFKVTSMNDSRTILEKSGAESLFGNGDMLYCPADGGEPVRLQGPYLGDEIIDIVGFIKEHNDCCFDANAEKFIQSDKQAEQDASALPTNTTENASDEDELFADALLSVIESGQPTISRLQRKFRIGYSRAARIIDIMEDRGFIGPTDASNKPRPVLITLEEYYQLYGEDGIQGGEAE